MSGREYQSKVGLCVFRVNIDCNVYLVKCNQKKKKNTFGKIRMIGNAYFQLIVVLLSVILVLSVLILYIVRQILQLKKEYEEKLSLKNSEKGMWIDRRQSEVISTLK